VRILYAAYAFGSEGTGNMDVFGPMREWAMRSFLSCPKTHPMEAATWSQICLRFSKWYYEEGRIKTLDLEGGRCGLLSPFNKKHAGTDSRDSRCRSSVLATISDEFDR